MRSANAHSLNEKTVPISDTLFNELVHAEPIDAVEIARQLPLENRARLAKFCYQRRHLNKLALLIASSCDRMTLRRAFGTAGDIIFQQSRNVEATLAEQQKDNKITLARSANVVSLRPVMDDADESGADEDNADGAQEA
ncbi:hypothetical protein ACFQ14_10405 [Pseudahrensia aquimaris]|uniref:DUF2019 domain-containing protein n=1 Tax=Pseudahrensia aquimaris TaxID=744461 RepID=A0ABW3FG07_9HYPH